MLNPNEVRAICSSLCGMAGKRQCRKRVTSRVLFWLWLVTMTSDTRLSTTRTERIAETGGMLICCERHRQSETERHQINADYLLSPVAMVHCSVIFFTLVTAIVLCTYLQVMIVFHACHFTLHSVMRSPPLQRSKQALHVGTR